MAVRERASKLDHFSRHILGCHVMLEEPHRRHQRGNIFHVRVDLTVPDEEIVIRRNPGQDHAHEDIRVAIRDAFDAARRRIEDYERRHKGYVKSREQGRIPARVSKLFPGEDYGFLESEDGREIYFHRNSVSEGGFDRLNVGDTVCFEEEEGWKGPQASSVQRAA